MLIFSALPAHAQKSGAISFSTTSIDYGEVAGWTSKIDTIYIRNKGSEPISFLRTTPPRNVEIKLPEQALQPGEKSFIAFIYAPQQIGAFNVEAPVYYTTSPNPVILRLQGEVVSFAPDAMINCPSFKRPSEDEALVEVSGEPSTTPEAEIVEDVMVFEVPEEKPGIPLSVDDSVELPPALYKPNNVVFLIDVSLSMDREDKLPYLKQSMINMLMHLRNIDKLTIVTYAEKARIVLPTTTADDKEAIADIINALAPGGRTKPSEGLKQAYNAAFDNYIDEGNNTIILASDGKFEAMGESQGKLNRYIKWQAIKGVNMSVVGFGNKTESIELLQRLSRNGNGRFLHVATQEAAEHALLEEIKEGSKKE